MSKLTETSNDRQRRRLGRHRAPEVVGPDGRPEPPEPRSSEVWAALFVIVVIVLLLALFVIPVLTMVL